MPTESFRNKPAQFLKQYSVMLLIVVVCLSIQLLNLQSNVEFQRDTFFSQPFRLLFSHFSHITWAHLLINLAACLAINHLFFKKMRNAWVLGIIVTLAIAISLELYFFSAYVEWYRGLSGVLHGFFVIGCLRSFKEEKIMASLLLLTITGKLLSEQFSQDTPSNMLGGASVIVDAHLWGAITGLFLGSLLLVKIFSSEISTRNKNN